MKLTSATLGTFFSKNNEKIVLYTISAGFFFILLDITALNVALATIGKDFSKSLSSLQWVVNSYTLSFASFMLSAGALGDRFGSKRFYQWGLFLFSSMSLCSALAPTLSVLIGARILQGIGAAIMLPTSLSLLNCAFPEPEKRAWAIGFWASIISLGFAAGSILGGTLVTLFGWRSIFWVNVPLGIIVLLMNHYFSKESTFSEPRKIDWKGHLAFGAALFFLTYAFIETGSLGWKSPVIFLAMGLALACGFLFYLSEKRTASPVLPEALFGNSTFTICTGMGCALNFSMYGILFLEAFYLQTHGHYSAFQVGLIILPFTFLPTVTTRLLNIRSSLAALRSRLIYGHVIGAIAAFLFIIALWKGALFFTLAGFAFLGVAMGAIMPAVTAGAMISSPAEISGLASGILNCSRQTGSVLGVAIMGTCMKLSPQLGVAAALFLAVLLFSTMALQSRRIQGTKKRDNKFS